MATPPVLVSIGGVPSAGGVPARDDQGGSHFFGPFVVGPALYLILVRESSHPAPVTGNLKVFKSIDNGKTWNSMDDAHSPATDSSTAEAILNGGVFTICYCAGTINNPLKVITFNTATDTFGVPSVDGPFTGSSARIAQFANGDLCIAYDQFGGGSPVNALIFSGGAFAAAVLIPNSKNSIGTIVMGANNIAQIFYYDQNAPGINVFFRTFTDGAALGAEQNVFSSATFINTPGSGIPIGRTLIWNGNFIVPYYGGPNGNQAGVWTGAPYTAPVWSFTIVDPVSQGPQVPGVQSGDVAAFAFVDSSNNLLLMWITQNDGANPNPPLPGSINFISYAMNSGSGFGSPILFYNETTNPQTVDPLHPNDFLHTLSAAKVSGTLAAITAMDLTNPSGIPGPVFCSGFFVMGAGCPKNSQGV